MLKAFYSSSFLRKLAVFSIRLIVLTPNVWLRKHPKRVPERSVVTSEISYSTKIYCLTKKSASFRKKTREATVGCDRTAESRKLTLANEFVASDKLALFLLRKNLFLNKEILRVSPSETRVAHECGHT